MPNLNSLLTVIVGLLLFILSPEAAVKLLAVYFVLSGILHLFSVHPAPASRAKDPFQTIERTPFSHRPTKTKSKSTDLDDSDDLEE